MENGGGAAPTGCYKCGRPGHWSRDCPSNPSSNPNDTNPKTTSYAFKAGGGASKAAVEKSTEKPKKVPRSRPNLTPDLLLSNDGIGYILRHFPRSFKYRGRGHEFVHKVEQIGGSKRVKICLRDLQERVASGADPTKLHEPPVQHDTSNHDQEAMNLEVPSLFPEDTSMQNHETDELPDVMMLHEIYEKATEEPSQALQEEIAAGNNTELSQQVTDNNNNTESRETQMSEEQKARIEANRLKALERAAARARASLASTT